MYEMMSSTKMQYLLQLDSQQFAHALIYLIVIIFGIALLLSWCSRNSQPRNSKKYRQFLADMFVSGKIRKYAESDKIDLVEEDRAFRMWSKKQIARYMSFDSAVEEDLKDRIAEDKFKFDKKLKTEEAKK